MSIDASQFMSDAMYDKLLHEFTWGRTNYKVFSRHDCL